MATCECARCEANATNLAKTVGLMFRESLRLNSSTVHTMKTSNCTFLQILLMLVVMLDKPDCASS